MRGVLPFSPCAPFFMDATPSLSPSSYPITATAVIKGTSNVPMGDCLLLGLDPADEIVNHLRLTSASTVVRISCQQGTRHGLFASLLELV